MGEPNAVPAGVYGRQWLERRGVWLKVQSKVVPLGSVRAVVAAVREGRADAGLVYVTDARSAPEVFVAFEVSDAEAPRIIYPAAVVKGPREEAARRFLLFLQSEEARATFQAAGFGLPS
jgi:molybdate transport system substrate-binding protein